MLRLLISIRPSHPAPAKDPAISQDMGRLVSRCTNRQEIDKHKLEQQPGNSSGGLGAFRRWIKELTYRFLQPQQKKAVFARVM